MRPTVWILLLMGCSGAQAPGSSALVDVDGDGWSVDGGDCNDANDAVYPGALDLPGDAIDQDCDGADDEALSALGLVAGDLVVTEFLRDPESVSGAVGEWFEVRNTRDVDVDLLGLSVVDDSGDDFTVSDSLLVPAGGLVVFGGWEDPELNGGVPVDYRWEADFSLSSLEDQIRLTVGFQTIDEVRWDVLWPEAEGVALSVGPEVDAEDNDSAEVWCGALNRYGPGGLGTPGDPNPPCGSDWTGPTVAQVIPGEIIITEILTDPSEAGNNGEWFELYSLRTEPVDLRGLQLSDDGDELHVVELSVILEPGATVVFGRDADPERNGGVDVDYAYGDALTLGNEADELVMSADGVEIDRVFWGAANGFPAPTGASISLDGTLLDGVSNDDGANWCEGVTPFGDGDLGTPGTVNPPC